VEVYFKNKKNSK